MPITGSIDVTDIIANLGDPDHGLRASGLEVNREVNEDEHIYRATYRGPVDISTSKALGVLDPHIWDVNEYYRSLGIEAPYKPTKKELRLGYQAVEGYNSERLTYYFKQLLDPRIRRAYDRMPLGKRFRDKYVIEEELRVLTNIASEETLERGELVTVNDLLHEHEERKALSKTQSSPQQGDGSDLILWHWGYYLLNSRKYDTAELQLWQEYLTTAMARRGITRKISIGYVGKTKKRYIVRNHENRVIYFLNENTAPSMELAIEATSRKRSRTRNRKKNKHVSTSSNPQGR